MITLEAHGWRAMILPKLGGALASLCHQGRPVLRSAGPDVADVLHCASFPLVPFANRIGGGQLRFADQMLQLEPDPVAWPHAHHGHGWRAAWNLEDIGPQHLVLSLDHRGDDAGSNRGWPWSYRAEQRMVIGPGGLTIDMAVMNMGTHAAMPCGAGIHPYFIRRRSSAIHLQATHIWANHDDGLAKEPVLTNLFQSPNPVLIDDLEGLDNFLPCTGPVTLFGDDLPLTLDGSNKAGVHLYVPPGEDYFCVEPVSHAPDAFGRGDYSSADILAPGATRHWRWNISQDALSI